MRWISRLTTFAVFAIAVAGMALLIRSRAPTAQASGKFHTYAKFRDGARLAVGSPVVIAGVQVGVISKLTVEDGLARIDMRLRDGLDLPVDSYATRRADSLFGDSYIEIIPSGEDAAARRLRDGEPIPHVVEGDSTDALLRGMAAAMPKVDNALDRVHDGALDGRTWVAGPFATRLRAAAAWLAEGHIERPLDSADRAMIALDEFTDSAQDAVATGGPELLRKLDSFDRTITTTRTRMREARSGFVSVMQDTRHGIDRVDEPLADAADLMTAIDRGKGDDWKGTLGRLVNEHELGDTITDATESVRDAAASLNRFKSWLGARIEADVFSRDVRFYATAELRARHDKFYLIEFERGPLGGLPHDELSDVANSPSYVRRQTIPDRLRFTAQFGKQFGPLALRGGIKDSTFGFGADVLMLDGRLKLSADTLGAFTSTPRIKLTGALAVFRTLYVIAGVDDAFNKPGYLPVVTGSATSPTVFDHVRYGRDYFVGGTLQFSDEDIAILLRLYGAVAASLLL